MNFEQWLRATGFSYVDLKALDRLFRQGLNPSQARQWVFDNGIEESDEGWPPKPVATREKKLGRPFANYDERRVIAKIFIAVVRACDDAPRSRLSKELAAWVDEAGTAFRLAGLDVERPRATMNEAWLAGIQTWLLQGARMIVEQAKRDRGEG